jgi:hypothetical protein
VFVGQEAGSNNSSGVANVFVGQNAGECNTTGNQNIVIGLEAGKKNTVGGENVIIGWRAGWTYNDTNSKDSYKKHNVFIGTLAGAGGDDITKTSTGLNNTIIGAYAGWAHSSGDGNTFLGTTAGRNNKSGAYNTFVGYYSGSANKTGSYNVYLGSGSKDCSEDESYKLRIGGIYANSGGTFYSRTIIYGDIQSSYIVINGTDSNSKKFYVNGAAGGSGDWNANSDVRLKKDIQTITGALDKVLKLRGVTYYWKNREEMAAAKGVPTDKLDYEYTEDKQIGVIAQELEKEFPEIVNTADDGFKSVEYGKLTPILIEAMKEQQAIIDNQQKEIDELKKMVEELMKK